MIYDWFGCHEEIVTYINGGAFSCRNQKRSGIAWDYVNQKRFASGRGIGWEITFPEWWDVWRESGNTYNRGIRKGQYVMSRYGDIGPYRVDNGQICTAIENVKEYYTDTPRAIIIGRSNERGKEKETRIGGFRLMDTA